MGCLPRSACLGSLSLTQSPNSLVLKESLEIRDNHLCLKVKVCMLQGPISFVPEFDHFFKGTIDLTLFIRRFHDDNLVVQVYVDDIIFGSTHPRYIQLFYDLMKSRFEMSMMGEMTFFLGLQVNQSPCGIFINQSKYVLEILKKYGMESCDPVGTPIEIKDKLDLDHNGTPVDATKYHSMIGALMYLTSSRPDIVHATCLCAQYQAKPTKKHLKEVIRIFHYIRGTVNMGLWYTKDFGFELTGFLDADYAGCKDTFKSTSGGAQFLGEKLVSWSSKKQDYTALSTAEAEYVSLSACCTQVLWMQTQAGGIYPGTLLLDRVEVLVTHWFTLIVLSALRRSGNENMLGLVNPHGFAGNIKGEWRYLFPVEPQLITTCSYPTNQDFRNSDVFEYEEEVFNALLDEGSKILHSIEGTILKEKLFAKFIAMTAKENSESESDIKELPFEKITFNTDYKIKTSLEEPPTDLELKPLMIT
uniref:Uncharacterized mitochondrial protein AtMg00810-like n=1 Tax=Tanacetum cinerariifolium TaxID=118510 RepID=A0A699H4T2_TANCI|nr:uncharacterized mitochondrial protein AtMg00810-like [Tanacetum cinerariifolium]